MREVIQSVEVDQIFADKDSILACLQDQAGKVGTDYARVDGFSETLFGQDIENFGKDTTVIFTNWEEQGGGPILPAMVLYAIERFDLDINDPCVKAAFLSALLAEYPNDLQYHGNEHYRKVLFHGIRLIVTHNEIYKGTNRALNPDQIAMLLAGSCIHDLGHEGGDNLREGVYTPGQMEQYAMDQGKP